MVRKYNFLMGNFWKSWDVMRLSGKGKSDIGKVQFQDQEVKELMDKREQVDKIACESGAAID